MKLTIEISDILLKRARKLAAREGVTMKALIEHSLKRVIDETQNPRGFKLRRAAFKGNDLQAEFRGASWKTIREASYERPRTTHET
jgi:hypothetical protein